MISIENRELHPDQVTTAEVIRGKFVEHQQELQWLASLLTGDEVVAEACVVDACGIAQKLSSVIGGGLAISPTFATIYSAIQVQKRRIAELSAIYESEAFLCGAQDQLPHECLELIVTNCDLVRRRLDVICRFALVMCGLEACPIAEVARWLGISESAVKSAYGAALESLEVIDCEARALEAGPGAWN